MKNIHRTVYGSYIQTCGFLGISPQIHPYTTLNEYHAILDDEVPVSGTMPYLRYFAIGKGGHRATIGKDDTVLTLPEPHMATDAGLFSPIPFVLREPGSDLDEASRRMYAHRKIIQDDDGNPWIAYYLRRLDLEGITVELEQRTYDKHGTIIDSQPFVPDSSNLHPKPKGLGNTGVNTIDGQYVSASARVNILFNRSQIDELLNVARVLYGSEYYALITELALVTGVDKVTTVTTPGEGSINFNEAIGTQVATHINTNYPVAFANNMIEIALDIGAQEPLFKFEPHLP